MVFDNKDKIKEFKYPFNWGADYKDGTFDREFDDNGKHTDFYSIRKDEIIRFGLYNESMKLFYQEDGSFYLNGQLIEIEYHIKDKVYNLTCNFDNKDCTTFKQDSMTPKGRGVQKSKLECIAFGYKTLITAKDDIQFYFKPLVILPFVGDNRAFIETTITSNKNLKGKLVFKNKSKIVDVFDFPLTKNYKSVINWTIK